VGRYTIHDEIASGGLGSVRFARLMGASGFTRTVVAKLAHEQFAQQPEFALMLIDEACLAARVLHPNVVSTLDAIQTADQLILVMDYVHGESVWKLMTAAAERGERVPIEVATSIIIDTLHGLHAAHEATDEQGHPLGIVHRDVSPQNILVGADGISRLVDFGIALAARRLQTATNAVTLKGKHGYMAPEQVAGEPVTRLTDTFAAAIVYWELLTGERLFLGRTDAETVHKCLVSRVRPPSRVVPGIPDAIDAVLKRALSREPSERYPTARDMALALEACVPPLRLSEIGSWVERMVGDTLRERSAVLARIEREESESKMALVASGQHQRFDDTTIVTPRTYPRGTQPTAGTSPATGGSADVLPARRPPPLESSGQSGFMRRPALGEEPPDGEPTRELGSTLSSRRPPNRSRAPWMVAGAALLLASIGGLVWMRSQQAQLRGPATRASTAETEPPPRLESEVAPPAAPGPPFRSARDIPIVPATDPPPAAVSASPRPQPRPTTSSSHTARPKPAPNPCKPPYYIDSLGREIFKPECL
jgi:serine/threonine-protein kinase